MKRKLGSRQQAVLVALSDHGAWSEGCGWLWGSYSETRAVLDTLVRAGYVKVTLSKPHTYTVITPRPSR